MTTSAELAPITTIVLSPCTSTHGIVEAAVRWLMDSPDSPREIGGAATIFTVQALPYYCDITLSPWSPLRPSKDKVVATIREKTGIEILPRDGEWR